MVGVAESVRLWRVGTDVRYQSKERCSMEEVEYLPVSTIVTRLIVGNAEAQSDKLLQCRYSCGGVLLVAEPFVFLAHDRDARSRPRRDLAMHT